MALNPFAKHWKLDSTIIGLCVSRDGERVAAAMGDGRVAYGEASDLLEEFSFVSAHLGVSLALVPDADSHAFLSGGDDGTLVLMDPLSGEAAPVAKRKGKWIDPIAASSQGMRAYAVGRQVFLLNAAGEETAVLDLPSTAGGLAFSPNGKRLAMAHYNGVSLVWTNAKEKTLETLPWKGSHLSLLWSPDGKTLLSSMQEGALHGWDFSGPVKELQMQGYAAKILSMGFTTGAKYLATGGADQIICWPFFGGGPWGKAPTMLGGSDGRLVACVAPHPRDPVVAAGYEDGMTILAPLDGRMEILLYPPDSSAGSRIVGLAWNGEGDGLFAAQENGNIFLYTLGSIRRYATGVGR